MPDTRQKVLAYIRTGCVVILDSATPEGEKRPNFVHAWVKGFRRSYRVVLDGGWSCTCGKTECAHQATVQLVTGWPSAAERSERRRAT